MHVRSAAVAVCAGLLALAGCAGPVGGASAERPPDAAADNRPTDPAATLTVALRRPSPNLDPARAPTTADEPQIDLFYDKLFRKGPDGTIAPELVESAEPTADGLVLKVRPGIRFQDGTALDAAAVKANIDRGRTIEGSGVRGDLAPIKDVEVVDPMTVLLHLAAPDVTIPAVLSTRAGAMVSPAAFDNPDLSLMPVGAGPFKIISNSPSSRLVMERWDGYWRPDLVDVARLEVVFLPDAVARLNAVRSGQADAAEIDANQAADAQAAGLRVESTVLQTTSCIQISSTNVPAFADERVRMATNLAIDREGIVKGVLNGHGKPTSQYFPEGSIAHDPDIPDSVPYDVERARALLTEAGYPDGFEFETFVGTTPSERELEAVSGSLAKAGIRMKLVPLVGNEGINRMWTQKVGQANASPCNTQVDPGLAIGYFLPDNLRNPNNLTSDRVTALHQQALREQDPAARQTLLRQITRELFEHPLSAVPLYSQTGTFALGPSVVGFDYPSSGLYTFRGVGVAQS